MAWSIWRNQESPNPGETLLGDSRKAKRNLGWKPNISFKELVKEMIRSDIDEAKRDKPYQRAEFRVNNYQE